MQTETKPLPPSQVEQTLLTDQDRIYNIILAVIHEVGQPLNNIKGAIDLLEMDHHLQQSQSAQQVLTILKNGVSQMLNTQTRFIHAARNGKQYQAEETGLIYMERFIPDLISNFSLYLQSKQITCTFAVSGDLPRIIVGDPQYLYQIIANLLSNAITHSPMKTAILLKCYPLGNEYCVSVIDQGPGIPADQLENVKLPGVQLVPGSPGIGKGLSIVQELVTLLKGRLEITSAHGQGTTAIIFLPLKAI